MDEIYHHALKLLRRRDYTVRQLSQRLEDKFGSVPPEAIRELVAKRFLDDRRFAENFVTKRSDGHPGRVREELTEAGIAPEIINLAISNVEWRSLRDALKAKMAVWHLRAPLNRREAARLFRALSRLGYSEDELREELEQLHEQ